MAIDPGSEDCPRCYGTKKCSEHEAKTLIGRYHARDGWCFMRQFDGSVTMARYAGPDPLTSTMLLEGPVTFPASLWASIVASMSNAGENGETFARALAFHNALKA